MKLGHRSDSKRIVRTEVNNQKRNMLMGILIIIAALMIVWVVSVGKQAERTVSVVMLSQNVYKNQTITADMLVQYDMIEAEFNKYATVSENGAARRRIVLWEERDMLIGSFAAYPLQRNTVAMYNNFITQRIDNSDSVLYSYPGKVVVSVDIASDELEAYKTFLQPGDRVNITAIYTDSTSVSEDGDAYSINTVRTEQVFTDVMLADLLNSDGESILDIYESYNDMTVYEQAALDADENFKDSVTPSSLLLALTQEELQSYYYYTSMDCEFKMSLPQRTD